MKNFRAKWSAAVKAKQSLLCVGLDPAEFGQRENKTIPEGMRKVEWCSEIIEAVSPHAAAIKINRNFIRDLRREETQSLTQLIHEKDMVAIDDAKLSDIGSSNHAGLYHAQIEGYDAVTFSPFPGNVAEGAQQARDLDIGIICLVLMSNPQYKALKSVTVGGKPFYRYLAELTAKEDVDGVVIGGISDQNHLSEAEVSAVKEILKDQLVLVPGVGAQGGSATHHLDLFGSRTIINVGRSVIYAEDPAVAAAEQNQALQSNPAYPIAA